jgi:VWFA-related protein
VLEAIGAMRTLAWLALLLPASALPQAREVPSFRTESRLVTIDVLVQDRNGNAVTGLAADDFVVTEDGVPQRIESFEAIGPDPGATSPGPSPAPGPVASNLRTPGRHGGSFILLLDDVGLAAHRAADVRKAIQGFLDDGLRDGDQLLLATTSGDVWWNARIPAGREDVRALLARLKGRRLAETTSDFMSEWEAYRITRFESLTGAALASGGGEAGAPGANVTERVVARWLERNVCDVRALELCRSMVVQRANGIDRARSARTRDVMARIDQAAFALSPQRGRKALLLLTEGFLNDPDLDVARLVAGRCREANIAVYSLDVRGLQPSFEELSAASSAGAPNSAELMLMRQEQDGFASAGSETFAEDTGGLALRDTNDLGAGGVRIADESRAYYLLGVVPPPGKGPRDWRSLSVSVRRPGLKLRARKGYTLRTAAEIDRGERAAQAERSRQRAAESGELKEPPPLEVSRALASSIDYDELPLQAIAFVFGPRPDGRVRSLVSLEVDLGRIANLGGESHPATVLSLSIAVTHRDSGEVRRIDQQVKVDSGQGGAAFAGGLTLSREFDLKPGVHQARVVVRDEFLGRTGAVTVRFEVPAPAGLRLSTPILTDRAVRARPSEAPRPVLVARRTFGTHGTLYAQYEVIGAAERGARVAASFELRQPDGASPRRGVPVISSVDAQGSVVQLLSFPLDGLASGDYELVLRVEDKAAGTVAERVELLRLGP